MTAVNDDPVAVDNSFTVAEDGTSAALDLVGNDTDIDLDSLSVQSINGTPLTGLAQSITVPNGTVNVSAAGVITFSPAANYNGGISFDYCLLDGSRGPRTSPVTGTASAASNEPVAVDDDFTVA